MKRIALVLATLLLALASVPALAAPPVDLEVGQQVLPAPSAYVQGRVTLKLFELPAIDTGFWLLPEAGVVFSPFRGYVRLQLLADAPWFTTGIDAKHNLKTVEWLRFFVRVSF